MSIYKILDRKNPDGVCIYQQGQRFLLFFFCLILIKQQLDNRKERLVPGVFIRILEVLIIKYIGEPNDSIKFTLRQLGLVLPMSIRALGLNEREANKHGQLYFEPPVLNYGMQQIINPLRTEEERFTNLKDYSFKPHYIMSKSHGDLRMHYLDERPPQGKEQGVILLLHGEPTWSYLYRHMIPELVKKNYRVVAPDLIGFGKSDKPRNLIDYTYERHIDWLSDFLIETNLWNITLFAQDWGGLLGLRILAKFPERFARVAISNTGLPTGQGGLVDKGNIGTGLCFRVWAGYASQKFQSWGAFMNVACEKSLTPEEQAAYDAPFPDESYKCGTRMFPRLVPQFSTHASVEENRGAWRRLQQWKKPFLTLFSDGDAVTRGGERLFQNNIPGAQGQKHRLLKASHFVQEDCPEELVEEIDVFIQADLRARNFSKIPII